MIETTIDHPVGGDVPDAPLTNDKAKPHVNERTISIPK